MTFDRTEIEKLTHEVGKRLSEKRFLHTLGVRRCALRLAELCMPEYSDSLEVAALLHDITKELPREEQYRLLSLSGETVCLDGSVGVLHSLTAPYVIKRDFPSFSEPIILGAVYNHTTGSPDMSTFDEIIFLADFIEETRTYEPSVLTRDFVFRNMSDGKYEENIKILHRACLMEIDATIKSLTSKNMRIDERTLKTRDALEKRI